MKVNKSYLPRKKNGNIYTAFRVKILCT